MREAHIGCALRASAGPVNSIRIRCASIKVRFHTESNSKTWIMFFYVVVDWCWLVLVVLVSGWVVLVSGWLVLVVGYSVRQSRSQFHQYTNEFSVQGPIQKLVQKLGLLFLYKMDH